MVRWSNSSLSQNEALQKYGCLFEEGKFIELGGVPTRPVNNEKMINSYSASKDFNKTNQMGQNHSTMSNTNNFRTHNNKSFYGKNLGKKKNSFFEATAEQSKKEEKSDMKNDILQNDYIQRENEDAQKNAEE